jgi:hypothetical protein
MKGERGRERGKDKAREGERGTQCGGRERERKKLLFQRPEHIALAKYWSQPLHTENLGTLTYMCASLLHFFFIRS